MKSRITFFLLFVSIPLPLFASDHTDMKGMHHGISGYFGYHTLHLVILGGGLIVATVLVLRDRFKVTNREPISDSSEKKERSV